MLLSIQRIGVSLLYCFLFALIFYFSGRNFFTGLLIIGAIHVLLGTLSGSTDSGTTKTIVQNATKYDSPGLFDTRQTYPEQSKADREALMKMNKHINRPSDFMHLLIKRDSTELLLSGIISIAMGLIPFLK